MNTQHENKYWNLTLTFIISFIIVVVFSLTQSLVLFFLVEPDTVQNKDYLHQLASSHLGLISLVSSLVGLFLVLFFIKFNTSAANVSVKEYLNLFTPSFKDFSIFLFLSCFLMFFIEFLTSRYPELFETDFAIESYRHANSLFLLYLGVGVIGPLFEEVLFRGFLFKAVQKSVFGSHGAVLFTAIVFSIIHVQYGLWIILCMLFPMAILLGYARLKSNSLLLPILLHSINNLLTCLITHFEVY